MGGEGSGRHADPIKTLMGFNQPQGSPDTLYLPNVSAVKQGAVKQTDVPIPLNAGDIANKSYVDSQISGENHWDDDGTYLHPYYPARGLYLSGSVGIGTTSPAHPLDVSGSMRLNTTTPTLNFRASGGGQVASIKMTEVVGSSARISITDDSSVERLTVLTRAGATQGNVGIGTTSPGAKLDVNGTTGDVLKVTTNAGSYTLNGYTWTAPSSYIINSGGYLNLNSGYAGAKITLTDGAGSLVVNNGNVGIGTASPLSKLDVVGAITTTASGGGEIRFSGVNGYYSFIESVQKRKANAWTLSLLGTDGNAADDAIGTDLMTVMYTGNVGIGTTSPSTKLHISGGALTISNTAAPSTPTNAGALFVSGGACWFIGSSGTVTQLAGA